MKRVKKLFLGNLYTKTEFTKLIKKEIRIDNIMNTTNPIINEFIKHSEHYKEFDENGNRYLYGVVKNENYSHTQQINLCIGRIKDNCVEKYISVNSTIELFFNGWINRTSELRTIVQQQIDNYRYNTWSPDKCELCKKPSQEYHVDHIVFFNKLVEDWLISHNLDIQSYSKLPEVERQKLCKDFSSYHQKHAKLRLICKHCNLIRKQ